MVRDTIARQLDVDKDSIKYEMEPGSGRYRNGTITFTARKGKSIDLRKIQEDLRITRLGKRTRSGVNYFDITVEGEVTALGKQTLMKVSGTGEQFSLVEDPKAKPKGGTKTPYQRLSEALARGEKIASVTGRVQGWSGQWPKVLSELAGQPDKDKEKPDKPNAKKPTLLVVTDFKTVKE
jgi:hypothetical protein